MTAAIDPFHDHKIQVQGFPDLHAGLTTVQKVRITFNVAKPAGVGAGNWDAHVVALPLAYKSQFVQCFSGAAAPINEGFVGWANGAAPITLGPIQVFCAPASTPTLPTYANSIIQATNDMVIPSDDLATYHVGPSRVIAAGFEVRNTTATLTQQGNVHVSHTSNHATDTVLSVNEMTAYKATAIFASGQVYTGAAKVYPLPPADISTLTKNPDAVNWEAKDGVYVPLRLESDYNPLVNKSGTPIYLHEVTEDGYSSAGFITQPAPIGNGISGDYFYGTANPCTPTQSRFVQTIPFQTASAYFSGLADSATLQVTYVAWIERAPTPWQADVMAFATPSPPYDPMAFKHYMDIVRRKQAGTKVADNDAGDWWDDALSIFSSVAGKAAPFLMAVPELGPALSGAAAASATAAKAIQASGRAVQESRRAARAANEARAAAAKAKQAQQKTKK